MLTFKLLNSNTQRYINTNSQIPSLEIEKAEQEANRFAENSLIDPQLWHEFISQITFNEAEHEVNKAKVIAFAKKLGIHSSIVVGRLQKEKHIQPQRMNGFKAKFSLEE